MPEQHLKIEHHGGVARLTMNRPQVHNAFDEHLIAELTAALETLAGDASVRAVVLAAEGRSFSAGADLNWMRRMAEFSQEDNLADALGLGHLMKALDTLPQPTVARVQGAALGGGVGLVACCDIALASEQAVFALSEVKLGLIPAVIAPYVVRAMGERQARRYFVTGERFGARRARELGLVHEVRAEEELDGALQELLDALATNGPGAMVEAKRLASFVARAPLDQAMLDETARRIAERRASREGREGVAAFLEKRRPAWVKKG